VANSEVYVLPLEDGARIEATSAKEVLIKDYLSMAAATQEAKDLGMLSDSEKQYLDRIQPMPNCPHDLRTKSDIDSTLLVNQGFSLTPDNQPSA
jgi:hypothetical protein